MVANGCGSHLLLMDANYAKYLATTRHIIAFSRSSSLIKTTIIVYSISKLRHHCSYSVELCILAGSNSQLK